MRRLLFVSYWVPPRHAIGTMRASHLLKHLHTFGWDVTVVTAGLDTPENGKACRYIETRYWNVRTAAKRVTHRTGVPFARAGHRRIFARWLAGAADLITYRDEHAGWLPFLSRTVRKLTATEHWDALLTTAPPMTVNVAAALGHRAVPWIADMRDLWAEDDSSTRSHLQTTFDDKFERAVLSGASTLVASSDLSAARFQRRYPAIPCIGIPTGFDDEEWRAVEFGGEKPCTLVYAGTLYRGKRDPGMLFAALRGVIEEGLAERREFRVDFYTEDEPWLTEAIDRFGLRDIVRVHGLQRREAILRAERRADRLILLAWDGPTAEGVVPGKLFEYFGARRRVLAIGGPPVSEVELLLLKTGSGARCSTVEQTKLELLDALKEHRAGAVRTIMPEAVQAYSGVSCARQFSEVLEHAVTSSIPHIRRRAY